jgi:hypothetical protein
MTLPLRASPVTVLPEEWEVLKQLVRTHSTAQQLVMRARLILQAADEVGSHTPTSRALSRIPTSRIASFAETASRL